MSFEFDGWYINLARDQSRRQRLEQQLRQFGWARHYRRFEAVDGRQPLPVESPLSPARTACWLSHQGVLARSRGESRILHVLEDDADLDPQLLSAMAALTADPRLEWDLIFTDLFFHPPLTPEQFVILARRLTTQREAGAITLQALGSIRFTGATSYFVHPRAIGPLFAALDGGWQHGVGRDVAVQRLVAAGRFKAYVCLPFLSGVTEQAAQSTIGGHGPAESALYRLRAAFRRGADPAALAATLPGRMADDPLLQLYLANLGSALSPLLAAAPASPEQAR